MSATIHTLCQLAGSVKEYLDVGDRDDCIAKLEESIGAELRVSFLAALSGIGNTLPYVRRGVCGRPDRIEHQSISDAVMICLDNCAVNELFMSVLAESMCPLVRALRVAIAEQYVTDNANELAIFAKGE